MPDSIHLHVEGNHIAFALWKKDVPTGYVYFFGGQNQTQFHNLS